MDYNKEIEELKQELKGFDTGNLGKVAEETENKTDEIKRKIVLLGAYEEIKRIDDINEKLRNDEIEEKEESEKYREPLSIEKEEVYKILLSWGGGEDGFKLTFKNDELQKGIYYMADWGEYKEVDLNDNEAEEVYNFYMFGDISSFKEQ